MVRIFSLTAAAAALALSTAGFAGEPEAKMEKASASHSGTPVKLVEFDGEFDLLKTSSRLRVWRSHLGYTLEVDAEGKPTDCKLEAEFRKVYVTKKLCSVLMKHHTFEPARDASDTPVAGEYTNRISYMDLRAKN